jgi:hypothetical protein
LAAFTGNRMRTIARVVRAGLLLATLGTASCGGSQGSASDPARAVAAANQRLMGSWVLVDFQPDLPLEPMLAQLLSMQMGKLTADLDGGRLVATGLGVQTTRTYRIDEASMDRFKITLFDETGVAYEAWGDFQGDAVRFESLTIPWRGHGTLKRAANSLAH